MTDEQMTAFEIQLYKATDPLLKKVAAGTPLTAYDWRTHFDSLFEIEGRFTLAIIDNQFKPGTVSTPWEPTDNNKPITDSFNEGAKSQLTHMKRLFFRRVSWPLISLDTKRPREDE